MNARGDHLEERRSGAGPASWAAQETRADAICERLQGRGGRHVARVVEVDDQAAEVELVPPAEPTPELQTFDRMNAPAAGALEVGEQRLALTFAEMRVLRWALHHLADNAELMVTQQRAVGSRTVQPAPLVRSIAVVLARFTAGHSHVDPPQLAEWRLKNGSRLEPIPPRVSRLVRPGRAPGLARAR